MSSTLRADYVRTLRATAEAVEGGHLDDPEARATFVATCRLSADRFDGLIGREEYLQRRAEIEAETRSLGARNRDLSTPRDHE